MSAKTKILVVKMRELIYTAIFLALIILLIVLLVAMFSSDDAGEPERAGKNTGQEAVLSEDAPADETGTEEIRPVPPGHRQPATQPGFIPSL